MILKSHLCGVAVTFDRFDADDIREPETYGSQTVNPYESLKNGRPQGSLYSQQKRKIADACEYMRLNAVHKPLIFVATSPGYTDQASEGKLIQKFTHNLRNGYDCKNYVWVREFTQAGFPHFHFVADMPNVSPIALSLYWSGLFGSDAVNSIRLGTNYHNGKRTYYLTSKQQAWYLTKYLGKAIGNCEQGAVKGKRSFRTFAVSQSLSKLSEPIEFKGKMVRSGRTFNAFMVTGKTVSISEDIRAWQRDAITYEYDGEFYSERFTSKWSSESGLLDADLRSRWNFKYSGFANTFKGFPKHWKLKKIDKPKPIQNDSIPVQPIECPF